MQFAVGNEDAYLYRLYMNDELSSSLSYFLEATDAQCKYVTTAFFSRKLHSHDNFFKCCYLSYAIHFYCDVCYLNLFRLNIYTDFGAVAHIGIPVKKH